MGAAPVNHKRVYRIMRGQNLLLARRYTERSDRTHNGKVVTLRSNLRWCSDGFEFTCWNGDIIRGAFIIDAHDREIIAWCAVANVGVSGSDVRDMMLEASSSGSAGIVRRNRSRCSATTDRPTGMPPLKWSTHRDRFIPISGGPEDGANETSPRRSC